MSVFENRGLTPDDGSSSGGPDSPAPGPADSQRNAGVTTDLQRLIDVAEVGLMMVAGDGAVGPVTSYVRTLIGGGDPSGDSPSADGLLDTLSARFAGYDFRGQIAETRELGRPIQYEIFTIDGRRFIVRSVLYDDPASVDGVVMIFFEITSASLSPDQQAWLAAIVSSSHDAIIGEDFDGRITSWNAAAEKLYGYSAEEAIGRHIDLIVPQERQQELDALFERMRRGEDIEPFETVRQGKNREQIHVRLHLSPVRDGSGSSIGVSAIVHDITDRRRLEEAFRATAEQLGHAVSVLPIPVMLHTVDGVILEISRAWSEITGYAREDVPTIAEWARRTFGDRHRTDRKRIEKLSSTSEPRPEEDLTVITRNGERRVWNFSSVPLGLDHRGRRIVITTATDITDRRRLERQILEISEREQRRIGRDLHDSLASHLSGIAMLGRSLAADARTGRPISADDLEEIAALARNGAEQARALAQGLSPFELDPEGLGSALTHLASSTSRLTGIDITFNGPERFPSLDGEVVSQLYWIAREAVTNAVRHSGAATISIELFTLPPQVILRVADDGHGINGAAANNGGMGISIMRYRANVIGGSLELQDGASGGLAVTCSVAVSEADGRISP